jgi:hypothetical protein
MLTSKSWTVGLRDIGSPPSSLYEVNRILLVDDVSYRLGEVARALNPASYHPCPVLPGGLPFTVRKYWCE